MYEATYLVLVLPFLVLFIIALFCPDLRQVSIWTALACAPAGIIGEIWLIPDYWNPPYLTLLVPGPWKFGIEDIIITGSFAGISAAGFEYFSKRQGFMSIPPISARTFLVMEGYGLVGCIIMVIGIHVLYLPAIHALFLAMVIILAFMTRSCISCILFMLPLAAAIAVAYMFYLIAVFSPVFPGAFGTVWNLPNTWGIMLYGVPAEEMIWAFLTALYCGIIYRVAATTPFPLGSRFWSGVYRNARGGGGRNGGASTAVCAAAADEGNP